MTHKQHLQNLRQNSRLGDNHAVVAVARGPVPFHLKLWGSCFVRADRPSGVSRSRNFSSSREVGGRITAWGNRHVVIVVARDSCLFISNFSGAALSAIAFSFTAWPRGKAILAV